MEKKLVLVVSLTQMRAQKFFFMDFTLTEC